MSRILRVFMVMVASLASVLAHATGSSDDTDFSQGASAMQISLQKEVYGILLSDTAEVQQEYRRMERSTRPTRWLRIVPF